jgi:hypothetical protein
MRLATHAIAERRHAEQLRGRIVEHERREALARRLFGAAVGILQDIFERGGEGNQAETR